MGSIDRRIEALEARLRPPEEDEKAETRKATTIAILNEVAGLKASRAVGYRGGTPMVRIEPEDIPGKILGPGYTTGEMWELAVRRVFERKREANPDGLDAEAIEGFVEEWTDFWRRISEENGHSWDEVEDDAT